MKALTLLAAIIILTSCATKWDTSEKTLAGAFILGQAINAGQMIALREKKEEGWHEINGFVRHVDGRAQTYIWKGITTTGVILLADQLSHKWRKRLLWTSNSLIFGLIAHDVYVGVGFKF